MSKLNKNVNNEEKEERLKTSESETVKEEKEVSESKAETESVKEENEVFDSKAESEPVKKEKKRFSFFKKKEKESSNSDSDKTKNRIRDRKWFKVIYAIVEFILLLPFRIIYWFFRTVYAMLNGILVVLAIALVAGILLSARVLPMYQEASATAYDKLTNIDASNFRQYSNTVIYDNKGKEIGEINAGDYHYVDIKDCSKYVQYGYIATEDKRFQDHIGIDLQSIARAGVSLIKHNGEITQGGSTITQQVIKNNVLSQEQSFSRKLVEVLLAPRLEQMFSKAQIMEFYVNTNYYGNGCYGIETASQYYFGKSSKDLTLAEAAMLCGVSNSPNKYNPVASMKLAKEKMNQVLKNMFGEGYISKEQYKDALTQDIKLSLEDESYDNDNYMISYALHCAALQLMKNDGFEFKYVFDTSTEEKDYNKSYSTMYTAKAALIRSGGYKIYTSFDQKLQKKLQKSIDNGLKNYTEVQDNGKYALQGASVCVDNRTGYIVAMVGGRGDKDEFNRAFLSTRQPGSCIKPLLVYAPAINEGIANPSSIYTDKAVYAIDGDASSYSPKNSGGGYRGDMTVREALARSINTVAFQLYKQTTSSKAISYLEKMQFSSLDVADNSAYSLCLGGFTTGVKVVDMAKGYSTLAMGGIYTDKNCLVKLDHETDGTLFDCETQYNNEIVYTEDTAFMMEDMMQGVVEEDYGTGKSIRSKDMIFGGKTGTTSSNKDAWFCGFSKYYTTAVWVGYDSPRVMAGMYGGTVPAKIFSNYMESIDINKKKADFDKPDTIKLRKVTNGKYSGKNIKVKHSIRWYLTRKSGTDWYSALNNEIYKDTQADLKLQSDINEATKYLEIFENFYIDSIEDALSVDTQYADLISRIDKISDDYVAGQLRERAQTRYETLSEIVETNWKDLIEEYYKEQEEQKEAEREKNDEDSKLKATELLKQNRIEKARWYLTELGKRDYYTNVAKLLLEDALNAVNRLKGYSEYDSYMTWYKTEKARVEKLPTEPEKPNTPKDNEDDVNVNPSDYPDDVFPDDEDDETEDDTEIEDTEEESEN